MAEIEFGEFETGDEAVEGFKDLLQLASTESFKVRQPNPQAQILAKIVAEGNLEDLNFDDVEKVFTDAGLYFERVILKSKKNDFFVAVFIENL